MAKEKIFYYHQFVTLILLHVRLFSRISGKHFGLSLSEFCILCFLNDSKRRTSVNDIQQLLSLQTESVRVLLAALEEKGLVLKYVDEFDKRRMLCQLTLAAQPIISDAKRVMIDHLERTFWRNLPGDELLRKDLVSYPREHMQSQHDQHEAHGPGVSLWNIAPPETWLVTLILDCTVLLAQWKRYPHYKANLSFNAYRILALLEKVEEEDSVHIAGQLFLPVSRVATGKKELTERGFVEERVSESDSRIKLLRCTKQGLRVLKKLNRGMRELTEYFYRQLSDDEIRMLNAWHMRMCCEVELVDREIQALV